MGKILGEHFLIEVTATEEDILTRLNNRENPEVWRDLYKQQQKIYQPWNPDLVYDTSKEKPTHFNEKFSELLRKNREK